MGIESDVHPGATGILDFPWPSSLKFDGFGTTFKMGFL